MTIGERSLCWRVMSKKLKTAQEVMRNQSWICYFFICLIAWKNSKASRNGIIENINGILLRLSFFFLAMNLNFPVFISLPVIKILYQISRDASDSTTLEDKIKPWGDIPHHNLSQVFEYNFSKTLIKFSREIFVF